MRNAEPGRHAMVDEPVNESLQAATQRVLDEHLVKSNGKCRSCGQWGPCPERERALRTIIRHMWLPVRTPGATLPELNGAKQVA